MTQLAKSSLIVALEREIDTFVQKASVETSDMLYRNRRAHDRLHRSIPIFFMRIDSGPANDHSATLFNVSNDGLAFYCDCGLPVGAVLAVKLAWSDTESRRIPAIVRHCEITQQGFRVGAQFAHHHHEARELVESLTHVWYG